VVIAASVDNGATWMPVAADSHPASPADSEAATYSFGQAGPAAVRATATDISGLSASAEQWVTVARAGQPPLGLSPAAASIVAGQSVSFSASGGATGNYSWSGAAAGTGPSQAVSFPMSGTFTVSVVDAGNSTFNPSLPAVATVTVQAPFYTLSVAATAGGTAAGGGSYPPNAQATAVAAPAPGSAFTGWTGDQAGSTPTLLVLMNASKSLVAHFAPILAQTITFTAPGAVSTRTPAFGLVATASSGLPVSFALDAGPATLASTTLTPSGAVGEVTVTAMQPGNGQFMAAPPVTVSFAVGNPPPGVVLLDDSAETKRSDRETRTTSFRSGPAE
jgi:hypothetical protein